MTHAVFPPVFSRRGALAAFGAAGAALALSGCRSHAQGRASGILTYLFEPEPTTITPLLTGTGPTGGVATKIYQGLASYDFDMGPRPLLASGWTHSPDLRNFTFDLRAGAAWHDGKPLTARDVIFSAHLLRQYNVYGKVVFSTLKDVTEIAPGRVQFTFGEPAPFFLGALGALIFPILPEHVFGKGDPLTNPALNRPVGSGPFRFKEWSPGSHILLERNDHYWEQGKPLLRGVSMRFIPDAGARVAAIEAGEIDLAPEAPVALSEYARLRQSPDLTFEPRGYDFYAGVMRAEFNLDDPRFRDIRVRRAFAHAINRAEIVRDLWFGQGTPLEGPISNVNKGFYLDQPLRYPFDLARTAALLDEAGFPAQANGVRFTVDVDYLPISDRCRKLADYLRSVLARVGVVLKVQSQDFPTYMRKVYQDRAFSLSINSMATGGDPVLGVQRSYWSQTARRGIPFGNASGYSNPKVDRLLESGAIETDPVKRKAIYDAFQQAIIEDLPVITILAQNYVTIARKGLIDHTTGAEGVTHGNLARAHFA